MERRYELLHFLAIFSIPVFFFLAFTLSNRIYGLDAWYWLSVGISTPLMHNALMVAVWFFILIMFSMIKNPQREYWFIAALFLTNIFYVRFLEIEYDDLIILLISLPLIVWFKNNPIKWITHYTISAGIMIGYYLARLSVNYLPEYGYSANSGATFWVFLLILPALYLVAANRKDWHFYTLLVLVGLFPNLNFVSVVLPLLIFAFYLDFLTDKNFSYNPNVLKFLLILAVAYAAVSGYQFLDRYNTEFENECDPQTLVCTDKPPMFLGHFYAWLGYMVDGHYGSCFCSGSDCLPPDIKLSCGSSTFLIS